MLGRAWQGAVAKLRPPLCSPRYGGFSTGHHCKSPVAMMMEKEGGGRGPVLRDHCPTYSPEKTLLSLSSEQRDLLPNSLCSPGLAMSLHKQPGLQQCNFHASNAYKSPSDVTPCSTLILQHNLSPREGACLQRVFAATLPSKQQDKAEFLPGAFLPAGRCLPEMESSCSRCSLYSWVTPDHLLCSALLWASTSPWDPPTKLSCNALSHGQCQTCLLTFTSGCIQRGLGLLRKWFPPFMRQSLYLLGSSLWAQSQQPFFGPKDPF